MLAQVLSSQRFLPSVAAEALGTLDRLEESEDSDDEPVAPCVRTNLATKLAEAQQPAPAPAAEKRSKAENARGRGGKEHSSSGRGRGGRGKGKDPPQSLSYREVLRTPRKGRSDDEKENPLMAKRAPLASPAENGRKAWTFYASDETVVTCLANRVVACPATWEKKYRGLARGDKVFIKVGSVLHGPMIATGPGATDQRVFGARYPFVVSVTWDGDSPRRVDVEGRMLRPGQWKQPSKQQRPALATVTPTSVAPRTPRTPCTPRTPRTPRTPAAPWAWMRGAAEGTEVTPSRCRSRCATPASPAVSVDFGAQTPRNWDSKPELCFASRLDPEPTAEPTAGPSTIYAGRLKFTM